MSVDRATDAQLDELADKGLRTLIQVLIATMLGTAAGIFLLPRLASPMALSIGGPEGSAFWFLSRSSAFAGYLLLWGSMMLGLAITNRMARVWPGGPVAFDLHQHLSLLALGAIVFHALILLGDPYIDYSLAEVLTPFRALGYREAWVGLGQLGLYMLAIVVASFYVRKRLGNAAWRAIHFLSFTTFILALFHGLRSGTDSPALWAQIIYWATGASILLMTIYRALVVEPERRRIVAQAARVPPGEALASPVDRR
jgi:predicted ferric reductase